MIGLFVASFVGLVVGGVLGRFAARRIVVPPPAVDRRPAADQAVQAAEALTVDAAGPTPVEALADLRQTWKQRRHDVRGALSPALLTAERLTNHADEQVRRAGQIVVQSLERAIDALADPAPGPPG